MRTEREPEAEGEGVPMTAGEAWGGADLSGWGRSPESGRKASKKKKLIQCLMF